MVLSKFIRSLQELIDKNEGASDMTVVTTSDEEANAYSKVYFDPALGIYNDGHFEPFNPEEDLPTNINAVLVN